MNITRSAVLAGCFLVGLSVSGCTVTTTPPDSDIAGDWSGTYTDGKSNASGALTATFAEAAGNVSGTLTISGWACSVSSQGNVSGSIAGADLQANVTFGVITAVTFTGNANGNQLTGSYSIASGVCSGNSGSFSLSK